MKRIEVAVVDDSPICRARLREILEAERDIRVVGEASSGAAALELLQRGRPQLLVLDLNMPKLGGLETIEHVMAQAPLPILVVTGQPGGKKQDAVFDAIRRGALDLAEKPGLSDIAAQRALRAKVRQLATVPVVHHVARHRLRSVPDEPPTDAKPPQRPGASPSPTCPVIGLGASAGGPTPLVRILRELPPTHPGAVAVVQHLPNGFAGSFAEFVQARIALRVVLVTGPTPIAPGTVYVATDDAHLIAEGPTRFTASAEPAIEGHRPAATALFRSLARAFGANAIGVILSGMGRDGVAGLLEMRSAGALTIAQDAATAAVFGMPRAAIEASATTVALPPAEIARLLVARTAPGRER